MTRDDVDDADIAICRYRLTHANGRPITGYFQPPNIPHAWDIRAARASRKWNAVLERATENPPRELRFIGLDRLKIDADWQRAVEKDEAQHQKERKRDAPFAKAMLG